PTSYTLSLHDALPIFKRHCQAQIELTAMVGKEVKRTYSHEKSDPALYDRMKAELYDKLFASVSKQIANKTERSALIKAIKDEFVDRKSTRLNSSHVKI